MRLIRPAIFALVLAGAFFYFTTWRSNSQLSMLHPSAWLPHPVQVEITEAAGNEGLDSEEQNNILVYRKNIPSVVNVTSRAMAFDFFYGLTPQEGQGSGFVIDKEGHILTNYHVVADARQVEVTLHNRKKYKATIVGTDPPHDLAVIQIKAPDLIPAVLGDSRNLQVGQKVYAIGNPFGLAGTMTRGIVSSIRPVREPNGATIDEAIQTDAAINPGNSGGPLMNWHGEVIGINTMILSSVGQNAGIGFAIPINTAKAVLNDLMTLGRVRRPALGVRTIPISAELADEMGLPVDYGLLIVQVIPGGSADQAGLRGGTERAYLGNIPIMLGGDLIVAIDGEKIEDEQTLSQMMNNHRAGDTVKVTIYRSKKKLDVNVALGEAREQV
ncbi:MAG TPA: trypsin-like peptidase domain-containing protein [Candidatus Sulfotelmatobacter sp.]|jgi:S1-C subfamily serine protease|nr:trypsin-like peptidase domain-containing protein [Candidatus Sulfotelmatobacter sp.]